jgi:hypothetical protein
MAHGHSEARRYPLGMLSDESILVIERANSAIVTEANLLQQAIHGILSKKAREEFAKSMRKLNVESRLLNDGSGEETSGGPPRLLPN